MNRRQFFVAASAALVSGSAPALARSGGRDDYDFNFGSVFTPRRQASRYRGKDVISFDQGSTGHGHHQHPRAAALLRAAERQGHSPWRRVGRQGFEWSGIAQIGFMRSWPEWHLPKEMIRWSCGNMAGGSPT